MHFIILSFPTKVPCTHTQCLTDIHINMINMKKQMKKTDHVWPSCVFTGGTNSSYALKKQKLLEAWDSIRVNLLNVRLEEMAPASTLCCLCGVIQDCGIIRCQECGPSAYYCEECCVKVHEHIIFHRPKKWNVSAT